MKKSLLLAVCAAFALNLGAVDLAKYNGKTITEKDIDPIILPTGQAISVLDLNKDQQKAIISDHLFANELLKEAKNKKYDTEKDFKDAVKRQEDKILLEYYHQKTILSQNVSDKEIKDFYDNNKDKFYIEGQNQVAHILVKTEKEAKDIASQLKDLKDQELAKKFIELAKTKSKEEAAKQTGGVLPPFDKNGKTQMGGSFVPEFVNAAVKLNVGEVSKPVKTTFGYHIILKLNESKNQTIELEQVKDDIKTNLQVEKYRKMLQDKKDNFIKKSKIEFK